ncbi:MAG: pilus assembly protein TadG-related protein [bacterium]
MHALLKNEKGQSLAIYVLLIGVLAGAMALSFDMGRAFLLKSRMQRAADAAALAAVRDLQYPLIAHQSALDFAGRNGFTNGADEISVAAYPSDQKSNWYVVEISQPSLHLLAPLVGIMKSNVSVSSVAEYNSYLPINITGGGEYGANGIVTLSVFGPYAYYSYGDAYSPRWLDNGQTNPDYKESGYNFAINVPQNYYTINGSNWMRVQIFDPDTWNNGGDDAAAGLRIDEIRSAPGGSHPQPANRRNTTVYSLYAADNTPEDLSDDVLIAKATYGPQVTSTDMKWVTPAGFEFNVGNYGTGRYRLNVQSSDGSSENGFNLRAGPPVSTFNPNNGTSITAIGAMPMNFNGSGAVTVVLGTVGAEAAGAKMHINKFDTDVGAKSITYRCDSLASQWSGILSDNGKWKEDIISIPDGYTGGKWTATYTAGLQDTSVWTMWFEGTGAGQPGFVRLVK